MIPKLSLNYIVPFLRKHSIWFNGIMLDAGAGSHPYRNIFSHMEYESTDHKGEQTYLCDLTTIPVPNKKYDLVLCTQVLEHVPEPDKVLSEINRVLKNNGSLLLTLPQSYHIHEAPHNYFNFTKYGIFYLLEKNGFSVTFFETQGNWYTFLADEFRSANRKNIVPLLLLWPFSELLFPILGYCLDYFDKSGLQSLGYNIVARKVA